MSTFGAQLSCAIGASRVAKVTAADRRKFLVRSGSLRLFANPERRPPQKAAATQTKRAGQAGRHSLKKLDWSGRARKFDVTAREDHANAGGRTVTGFEGEGLYASGTQKRGERNAGRGFHDDFHALPNELCGGDNFFFADGDN